MRKIVSAVAAASIALSAVPTAFALGSPYESSSKQNITFLPRTGVRVSKRALTKAARLRDMDLKKCGEFTSREREECLNKHQKFGRDLTTRRTSSTADRRRARQIITAPDFFLGDTDDAQRMSRRGTVRTVRGRLPVKVIRRSNRVLKKQVRRRGRGRKECKNITDAIERGRCLNPTLHRRAKMMDHSGRSGRQDKSALMLNQKMYKLQDGKVWWKTAIGSEWSEAVMPVWQNKDGDWITISNNALMGSIDNGKNWAEIAGWIWQGTDNKWYKFDEDWTLWSTEDNGITWVEVPGQTWPGM